jgi:hypothetical protein
VAESVARLRQVYGIPAAGLDAWAELAQVLHTDGPAPCEVEPDSWWPTQADSPDELAVRICAGCPVRPECLAYALAAGERDGVWGGLTPAERARLGVPVAA